MQQQRNLYLAILQQQYANNDYIITNYTQQQLIDPTILEINKISNEIRINNIFEYTTQGIKENVKEYLDDILLTVSYQCEKRKQIVQNIHYICSQMNLPFKPSNVIKFEKERQKRIQQQTEFNLKITSLNSDKINELLLQEYQNYSDNKIITPYYQDILQKLSLFYYESLQRVQITPQDLLQGDIEEVFYKKVHNHQDDLKRIFQPVSLLNITMKPYQIDGLRFLLSMFMSRLTPQQPVTGKLASGLVLADDQGLGKTITSIAFLSYLKEKGLCRNATHLIICPLAVSDNWMNEFKNHCRNLQVICYKGTERVQQRKQILKQTNQIDVIVTTYNYILQDLKLFKKLDFSAVIVDEATRIKNQKSKLIGILRNDIKCRCRILLSGTPLQNNIREFFTLLQFIHGSIFNDFKTFDQIFKHVLDKTDDYNDQDEQLITEEASETEMTNRSETSITTSTTTMTTTSTSTMLSPQQKQFIIDRLHGIIKPFLIRRLKKDVLDFLPPKFEHVVRCQLTEFQTYLYKMAIKADSQSQQMFGNNLSILPTNYINNIQMYLRKICNHPYIALNKDQQYILKQQDNQLVKQISQNFFQEQQNQNNTTKQISIDQNMLQTKIQSDILKHMSGKLNLLANILLKMKQTQHRVLIFSQFKQVLDILERFVQLQNYTYFRFDGEVKDSDRNKMVQEFNKQNSKYFCFLLSTRAASHGLNLQSADTVIIYDCDFNAFNDLQASDRVYRIGQTKVVKIIKLYTNTLLEEKMYQIARNKMQLAETVINNDKFNQNEKSEPIKIKKEDFINIAKNVIVNQITTGQVIDENVQLTSQQELNQILARSAREVEIFEQIDHKLQQNDIKLYGNTILHQFEQPPQFLIDQQNSLQLQMQQEYQLQQQKKEHKNKEFTSQNTEEDKYVNIEPYHFKNENNFKNLTQMVTTNEIQKDLTIQNVKNFFNQKISQQNDIFAQNLLQNIKVDYIQQFADEIINKVDCFKICSSKYQNNDFQGLKCNIFYIKTPFNYFLEVKVQKFALNKLYIKYKMSPQDGVKNLLNFNIRLIMTLHLSLLANTNEFDYDDVTDTIPYYYAYLFYDFQDDNVTNLKQILQRCLTCGYYRIEDFIDDVKQIQKYCKDKYGTQDLIYKLSVDMQNIIINNLVLFFDQTDIEEKNDIITEISNINDCICDILDNSQIVQKQDIQDEQEILFFGQGYYCSGLIQEFYPGKYGSELRSLLQSNCSANATSLGYTNARKQLYGYIENDPNDQAVYDIYTGSRMACGYESNSTSCNSELNCEHTIPQSFFNENEPMKSDLHHMRGSWEKSNNARSNYPFAEVSDSNVYKWYGNNFTETQTAPSKSEEYLWSKLEKGQYFEPRDYQKADIARIVAYFYTRYPTQAGPITKTIVSVDTMIKWAETYKPNQTQYDQYYRTVEVQGNINPYYEEEGLVARAYCDMSEGNYSCKDYQ